MTIRSRVIVLDLDDTLYSEIDYLKSAYNYIAQKVSKESNELYQLMLEKYYKNQDVFDFVADQYNFKKSELLNIYRYHVPEIELYSGVKTFLNCYKLNTSLALVTDGRSKTQRNKIKSLGLEGVFDNVIISEEIGSEKPCKINFEKAISNLKGDCFFYIGDNLKKDFITPNIMGWTTICLKDQGENIHKQDFGISSNYQPKYCFENWSEILNFFNANIEV